METLRIANSEIPQATMRRATQDSLTPTGSILLLAAVDGVFLQLPRDVKA